jgi:hypothetical protein
MGYGHLIQLCFSQGARTNTHSAQASRRMKHDMGGMKHDMGGIKHNMREMKHMVRLLLEKQGLTDDRLDHNFKGIQLSLIDIPEAF